MGAMANLLDKLTVLVRSGVNSLVDPVRPAGRRTPLRPGKHVDREIAALRAQIDQALDDEDRIAAEVAALHREADEWDQRADALLQANDEAGARHAIRQMQLARQRAALREADREQHRRSTSELISKVNALEALVAEARYTERTAEAPRPTERLEAAPEALAAEPAQVDERTIEEDLARRRARLSQ